MLQRNQVARVQSAVALADSQLVAGVAGKVIVVHWVLVTSAVAGIVTLESGTATRLLEFYPDASGGAALVGGGEVELSRTAAGEALTVTSNITGNHFVAVGYTVRTP